MAAKQEQQQQEQQEEKEEKGSRCRRSSCTMPRDAHADHCRAPFISHANESYEARAGPGTGRANREELRRLPCGGSNLASARTSGCRLGCSLDDDHHDLGRHRRRPTMLLLLSSSSSSSPSTGTAEKTPPAYAGIGSFSGSGQIRFHPLHSEVATSTCSGGGGGGADRSSSSSRHGNRARQVRLHLEPPPPDCQTDVNSCPLPAEPVVISEPLEWRQSSRSAPTHTSSGGHQKRCQATTTIRGAANVMGKAPRSQQAVILSAIVSPHNWSRRRRRRRRLRRRRRWPHSGCSIMMIDYAPTAAAATATAAKSDKSGAPNAISRLLPLLLGLFLAVGAVARAANPADPKLELWRRLVEPALGELGVTAPGELEQSRERLATRLSQWPDQRRAALFYLDLLARRSRIAGTGEGPGGATCRRVALAELEAANVPGSPLAAHWSSMASDVDTPETAAQMAAFVRAHELNGADQRAALLLNQEAAAAAKLALENANLISRLLIYPESNVMRQLASPKFFKYLLESKVQQQQQQQQQQQSAAIHSLGLAFFDDSAGSRSASQQVPAVERTFEANINGSDAGDPIGGCSFAPLALAPTPTRPVAYTLDLAPRPVEQTHNGYFGLRSGNPQPFVAKWLLAEWPGELEPLASKLLDQSTSAAGSGLDLGDGRWFSPYFDCGHSERWLITYSVPFFGAALRSMDGSGQVSSADSRRQLEAIRFRGVSFVSLELARTGLVNQCASEHSGAFLANTHHCARLERSQCVRLANFREIRSGGYLCQCPVGSAPPAAHLRANEERRDALAEQVANMGQVNASHALDQLALDLMDERLTERSQLLELLQVNRSDGSELAGSAVAAAQHFEPGAQLEADSALTWLSGSEESDPHDYDLVTRWPRMSCNACRTAAPTNDSDPSTSGATCDEPAAPATQSSSSTTSSGLANNSGGWRNARYLTSGATWIRPLIVALQSVCALLALALVGLMLRIRKSRIILVSGWLMLETTLLGALILYSSVFLHHFRATSITCLLEPWLRELGFSILYGSILIKLYRILTEFQTRKAHRVCFRDKDQIVYLLAIVLIVVGYMSAWTALMVDGFLFSSTRSPGHSSEHHFARNDQTSPTWLSPLWPDVSQWSHLSGLASKLSSFSDLFSGLLEETSSTSSSSSPTWSTSSNLVNSNGGDTFGSSQTDIIGATTPGYLALDSVTITTTTTSTTSMRCRKLTWDYVTELSEMGLLLFGLYLVYKLRNASSEVYKEKVVLSASLLIELTVSTLTYAIRHAFWSRLSSDQLLILYFMRCQLTVTPTLLLVFGPKIWTIGKTRPGFLAAAIGVATNRTPSSGGSMRHRCHISCELHEHHLNDAKRLHQAMLSNSALDIGTINLADMDPDEIQAELKRVYAQLEVLKTKVMRRDNPHISKRRGGRKTGHRKFSLQAFHVRHIGGGGGGHAHSSQSHPSDAPAADDSPSMTASQQQRLATLGETKPEGLGALASPNPSPRRTSSAVTGERRVRLEAEAAHNLNSTQQQHHVRHNNNNNNLHYHHHHRNNHRTNQMHLKGSSGGGGAGGDNSPKLDKGCPLVNMTTGAQPSNLGSHQSGKLTQAAATTATTTAVTVQADPVSSSSAYVCFDDDTLILNDSQSSGNVSPQRRSSFICSHSSIQREDSSFN